MLVRRWPMAAVLALVVVVAGVVGVVALRGQPGVAGEAVAAAGVSAAADLGEATSVPSSSVSPTTTTSTTTTTASAPPKAPTPAAAPLAGKLQPGVTRTGVATFYDSNGSGACSYDASPDPLTAAMNWSDYEDSAACGAYVLVKAANGKSITVRITNLCPAPCRVGQLDLSAQAFAQLAPPVQGEIPITWTLVSPALSKKISIRYKTGSSQYWCGIQVIDHRNPVARLEVQAGGQWRQLKRADYNYFLSENGAGCGGQVAVTDLYGERLVLNALPVKPDVIQPTTVQFAQH
ncbi:expansin EXLX1 family cellulose-binding protein [Lentzea aerocolonigenes]|uniref:expansin EXLX1 family cellulose-binding protein n=1 Tax=Lentzea aerocolonigenes TaxID=68170 RepID=UPI000AACC85C|nr:expansin EXLX1 family cellulose-binding protein [Lentzea aerocolonigenes]MCP2245954.1 Peptidoglycan-binding domain-containing protein, expansin [Lentzea aerocolonigenes]